ncbi:MULTISPECIES: flagellar biosynthetic protein FliO [unclassified Bradyrhizobium]|uniref:flagellar biosynthetic protein FliO n=1 Tax=unclassified Bradyrhizobium TaxID=2631580 RepID=UPI002916C329|nr:MULTISPECIES: flagellar biosynthetic protein FliO [unclassified Bradyrhizobium]
MPAPLTFFFAFLAVLALIGLAAWLVRRFAGSRLGTNTSRGRMPRLAVIDAAAVDGRRRLVLVRRDNMEHLLMIGGPTDIVVESNIVRAMPMREQLPRAGVAAESPPPPRIAPLPDAPVWPESEAAKSETPEAHEPQMPELPPRPLRPAFADEHRRPAPILSERRGEPRSEGRGDLADRREPLTGFTPEPMPGRPEQRPEPRHELRGEPRMEPRPERMMRSEPAAPRPLRPAEPSRLPELPKEPAKDAPREFSRELPREPSRELPRELTREVPLTREAPRPAALRAAERAPERPAVAPPPPPPPPPTPAAPPQQSAEANLAEMAQRLEAALRRPAGEAPAPAAATQEPQARPPAARNEPPPVPPAPPKSSFENLEDEMASLLGRPKSSQ